MLLCLPYSVIPANQISGTASYAEWEAWSDTGDSDPACMQEGISSISLSWLWMRRKYHHNPNLDSFDRAPSSSYRCHLEISMERQQQELTSQWHIMSDFSAQRTSHASPLSIGLPLKNPPVHLNFGIADLRNDTFDRTSIRVHRWLPLRLLYTAPMPQTCATTSKPFTRLLGKPLDSG